MGIRDQTTLIKIVQLKLNVEGSSLGVGLDKLFT